ncbi:MAG: capsular biosynthesis protein [Eubacteriales bacterium]|nr:capsular biosynthesis protein [Eubacteriales bacterium]
MIGLYDIHCHILPGVDDGARNMEEACWMLKKEYSEGVRRIILTPHFRREMFEPPQELVMQQFHKVQKAAAGISEDLKLYLGCELHASMDMVAGLKSGKRLTMAGSRYVLTEFGNCDEKAYIRERIQQLILNGYIPIIAHIERCQALKNDISFIEELKNLKACIQVNADSISGKEGFMMKLFCKKLMKQDLLDFIGTDGHGSKRRVPEIAKCFQQVEKTMGAHYAKRIFIENPKKITG